MKVIIYMYMLSYVIALEGFSRLCFKEVGVCEAFGLPREKISPKGHPRLVYPESGREHLKPKIHYQNTWNENEP